MRIAKTLYERSHLRRHTWAPLGAQVSRIRAKALILALTRANPG